MYMAEFVSPDLLNRSAQHSQLFCFFIHHALNGPPHCLRSQVKTVGKRGPAVDSEALAAVDSRDFDTMVDMVLRKHMELSHAMDCFVKEGRINISAQMLGIY